jgi:hypothetical protein
MFVFTKPKREALVVVRLPTDADIRAVVSRDSRFLLLGILRAFQRSL